MGVWEVTKPGIYQSFPAGRYHADPCDEPSLNYSTAKELVERSAHHAWKQHPKLGNQPRDPNKGMDRGNIAHAMLLGQPSNVEVLDFDSYRTKAAQQQRDDARDVGKQVILRREMDELESGITLIRANLLDSEVDLSGPCEQTLVWLSDEVTTCRTRLDNTTKDLVQVYDLKCTEDANPRDLEGHIHKMCYDLQAAIAIDAIETLHPELVGRVAFANVFIEMEHPYFVVRADHSESMLEVGRSKWKRAKALWEKCLNSGKWPGYTNRITAHAARWAYNREFGDSL